MSYPVMLLAEHCWNCGAMDYKLFDEDDCCEACYYQDSKVLVWVNKVDSKPTEKDIANHIQKMERLEDCLQEDIWELQDILHKVKKEIINYKPITPFDRKLLNIINGYYKDDLNEKQNK